jgi:hypothetical protein
LEIIDEEEIPAAVEVDEATPEEGVLRAQEVEILETDERADEPAMEEVPRALPVDPDEIPEE